MNKNIKNNYILILRFAKLFTLVFIMTSFIVVFSSIAYAAGERFCIRYNGVDTYFDYSGQNFDMCVGTRGICWAYGQWIQVWDGNEKYDGQNFGQGTTKWSGSYPAPRTNDVNTVAVSGHKYYYYVAVTANSSYNWDQYPFVATITAVDHSYTSTVTTAATCTSTGVRTYTCSRCGGSYTETIPKTGHSEKSSWEKDSSGHWKVCSVCGATTTSKSSHTDGNKDGLCDTCSYRMYTIISVPSAVTGLVYNGSTKTGVPSGTGYTITGNTATDAGNYTATCTLKSGYRWTGADSSNKSVSWSIARATGAITLAATSRPINIWG